MLFPGFSNLSTNLLGILFSIITLIHSPIVNQPNQVFEANSQFSIQHSAIIMNPSSTPEPDSPSSSLLLPDAEVVYSPTALDFDVDAYLQENGGFLSEFEQYLMITGWTSAAEIIERVALENSINPRLLIALLEYQSGCILGHPDDTEHFDTAMGAGDYYRKDLYGQLVWAAKVLSEGFYGRLDGSDRKSVV